MPVAVPPKPARVTVTLPDLFVGFLTDPPKVNPHFSKCKDESEDWIIKYCQFDVKMGKKIKYCNFSYFVSISAPEAPADELMTLCDWGNWVFPYDDQFDNGHLKDDTENAKAMMTSLMSIMTDDTPTPTSSPKDSLIRVHDKVWDRVRAGSPTCVAKRFAHAMQDYCDGALQHVQDLSGRRNPSLEEMLETRRKSSGVRPLYALVEYAHGLEVAQDVFERESVKALETLGVDFVLLHNDILSHLKEETENVSNNLVATCRINGMSAQEAFDVVNGLVLERFDLWNAAMADVEIWADDQTLAYVEGIKNVVKANLYWSFNSQRYFGPAYKEVQRTRKLSMLVDPPFLHSMVPVI